MRTRSALLALLLSALGCAGTETGNPSITGQLALDAHSSAPERVSLRGASAPVVIDEAWLSIAAVTLLEGSDCSDRTRRRASGALGSADHAVPGAAVTTLELDAGEYCAVGVTFSRASSLPTGAPSELEGHSLVLKGTLSDGAPFILAGRVDTELRALAVEGSFTLERGQAALFIGFDVARWFENVDFAGAESDNDGSIVIDEQNNPELLANFEAALSSGIEIYRDADADAVLDEVPELVGRGTP
jgi:hypothetical protein